MIIITQESHSVFYARLSSDFKYRFPSRFLYQVLIPFSIADSHSVFYTRFSSRFLYQTLTPLSTPNTHQFPTLNSHPISYGEHSAFPSPPAVYASATAVLNERGRLPCDVSSQLANDRVVLILWYRGSTGTPLYR